jgi:hypothetical protein
MSTGNGRGAPKGNSNALSHGLVAFKNKRRRARSLIDRRTTAGRNAVAVREEILRDLGGAEGLSATKLVLVEMTARDVYFLDEIDSADIQGDLQSVRHGESTDKARQGEVPQAHRDAVLIPPERRYFQVMAQSAMDKNPPGSKLDVLAGEKVFGWKIRG